MSIEVVARVLNTATGLPIGVKTTLLGLANHANPDGTKCFPSRALLARYAECDPRSITTHLKRLRDEGWIELIVEARHHKASEYRIRVERLSTLGARVEDPGVEGGSLTHLRVEEASSTRTVIEPSVEPSSLDQPSVDRVFDHFWEIYPRKIGKGKARPAFARALKRGTSGQIFEGVKALVAEQREKRFIPHPTTWLNRDGWLDEHEAPSPNPDHNGAEIREMRPYDVNRYWDERAQEGADA